jgi:hypothetical protein
MKQAVLPRHLTEKEKADPSKFLADKPKVDSYEKHVIKTIAELIT